MRKARSASAILACEAREPLTSYGRVTHEWGEKNFLFFSVSLQPSSPFLHSLQTYYSNTALGARIRKLLCHTRAILGQNNTQTLRVAAE